MYVCVVLTVSCIIFLHTRLLLKKCTCCKRTRLYSLLVFFFSFTSENLEFYGANILCDNCIIIINYYAGILHWIMMRHAVDASMSHLVYLSAHAHSKYGVL